MKFYLPTDKNCLSCCFLLSHTLSGGTKIDFTLIMLINILSSLMFICLISSWMLALMERTNRRQSNKFFYWFRFFIFPYSFRPIPLDSMIDCILTAQTDESSYYKLMPTHVSAPFPICGFWTWEHYVNMKFNRNLSSEKGENGKFIDTKSDFQTFPPHTNKSETFSLRLCISIKFNHITTIELLFHSRHFKNDLLRFSVTEINPGNFKM